MKPSIACWGTTTILLAIGIASAGSAVEPPPQAGAKSLVEIVKGLEQEGYGPFTELSMDDGAWEVEVRRQEMPLELTVDPVTGKVLSEHRDDSEPAPAADAMPLSRLLLAISAQGNYGHFEEVSFERRYWEIEVYKNGQKRELHVDPITAKVIANRLDD